MKISQKLVRRIFLILSPLFLVTTMWGCFEDFLTVICFFGGGAGRIINDSGFTENRVTQIWVGTEGDVWFTQDGGIDYCTFVDFLFIQGANSLNGVTLYGQDSIGNIIVGGNGTLVQVVNGDEINFIPNPTTVTLRDICQDLDFKMAQVQSPNVVTVGDSGTVMKSTDHGLSWSVLNFPVLNNLRTCTLRGDYILVGGDGYAAYQSEDFGETWEQIGIGDNKNSVGPTSFNAIFFVDENVGYIGGPWGLMGKTTDGGANWETFGVPDFEEIYDLFFISPDSGVAVGSPGMVRFTADGGITWEEDTEVTKLIGGKNIKKISAIDEVTGRIIGDSLHIIFSTDSTLLSVHNEDGIHVHNYSLSNNYPNPFNPVTTIKYQIPELSFVTLKVYDVLGSEITTLVSEEKSTGSYEVEFSATGGATSLPSGIYFYRLQVYPANGGTGNFVETKKMVLMK